MHVLRFFPLEAIRSISENHLPQIHMPNTYGLPRMYVLDVCCGPRSGWQLAPMPIGGESWHTTTKCSCWAQSAFSQLASPTIHDYGRYARWKPETHHYCHFHSQVAAAQFHTIMPAGG